MRIKKFREVKGLAAVQLNGTVKYLLNVLV